MLRLVILLVGGSILVALGMWYFFHELATLWVSLAGLLKALSLKAVLGALLAYLLTVARRLLLWELPKRFAYLFGWMLLMPGTRRLISDASRKVKRLYWRLWERVSAAYTLLRNRHVGFFFATILTVLLFAAGALLFGTYFFVWLGKKQLLYLLEPVREYLWPWVHNSFVRFFGFLHLDRLWAWGFNKIPTMARERYRQVMFRIMYNTIKRRRVVHRRVNDRVRARREARAKKKAPLPEAAE